jgi:hypothetical protein
VSICDKKELWLCADHQSLWESELNIIGILCYAHKKEAKMASNTKKTDSIRKRKRTTQGKKRKKVMTKMSTPVFPIHPDKDE